MPEHLRKQLHDWLNKPEARILLDWISGKAAEQTAEAGNLLVSEEICDNNESKKKAFEARKYVNAWEVVMEARNPETKFESPVLQPKPVTTV